MKALVVEHLADEGTGLLADWLPRAGLALDVHRVDRDGPPPATFGHDALVVMGGAMGVPDADSTHPELHADLALIRGALATGRPVLGVCLGAQLLAAACGGVVVRGRVGPELGVRRVYLTEHAAGDPLLHGLPAVVDVVQWHFDEVATLPPGATLLGSSPAYPHQAFRVGGRAWGVQFHPEATPSMVRRWAAADAAVVRALGEDPDGHVADVEAAAPDLARTWAPLAGRFARVVREATRTGPAVVPGLLP